MSSLELWTIGLQIALPLALVAWLALAPVYSRIGFIVRVLGTGLALAALGLVAVWMIPPWWTPLAYLALFALVVLWKLPGALGAPWILPENWRDWLVLALFGALGIWATSVIAGAVQGRQPPAGADLVDLSFPMGPGTYLVASGGASESVNGHFLTLNPTTRRQRDYRGQSFAVDLIRMDDLGFRASSWRPADPAAYAIFGDPVIAPCNGKVLRAEDGMPDMQVPQTDTSRIEGNHVVIQCGDVAVLLAHLRQGSVRVAAGNQVQAGDQLGDAGNSGQSTEPHLHIHAQRAPASGPLLSGEPIHVRLDGRFPVRNDRFEIE